MARTIDLIIRDSLGNQSVEIIKLQAEIEALVDRVKELEALVPAPEVK
jgi:hypothetical protein